MNADTLLIVLVAIVMVVGVGGTVLPILPGLWLVWGAAVFYGLFAGFGPIGWVAIVFISGLAAAGTAASVYLPHRKAASVGVPWWGQILALALSVAGFFFVPVVGAPLGFALGVFLATTLTLHHIPGALAATWETLKGMLLTSGLQLAASLMMVAAWVLWVWAG